VKENRGLGRRQEKGSAKKKKSARHCMKVLDGFCVKRGNATRMDKEEQGDMGEKGGRPDVSLEKRHCDS